MIDASQNVIDIISSPVRKIEARVELYGGSTLVDTFYHNGKLISFEIERVGDESKFFGYGVCQKINIKLIDKDRELSGERAITTSNHFKIIYTIGGEDVITHPNFYVTEVHRDENTNELSITAYDALKDIDKLTAADVDFEPFVNTIIGFMSNCAQTLGLWVYDESGEIIDFGTDVWAHRTSAYEITYADDLSDVNLEGTETLRSVLNALAEANYSIYYMDGYNRLHFKQLTYTHNGELNIDKSQYITLESGTNRKLTTVVHTTDLNDNLSATTGEIGTTQYLRSNPYMSLNPDYAVTFLNSILEQIGNMTINQFNMEWRGNPLVEIGDKLVLTTKDNNTVTSYLLNDTLSYNGAFAQSTSWNYQDNEEETESTPATLGEALKMTMAKVDKANNEISLLAKSTDEKIDSVSGDVKSLTSQVEAKLNSSEFEIKITEALENVDGISTKENKFTFNDEGLTISKSDTDISTKIDEDGMVVSKGDEAVLTADNTGVNAINLTARQYLIIGTNSRFEDYGERTGCFWIGG